MKYRKPIYAYFNREFIGKFKSIMEAADKANVTPCTVGKIANKQSKSSCTRNGYTFSFQPLTQEELDKIPIKNINDKGYTRVDGKSCKQIVDEQAYEVNCNDPKVLWIPKSKEGKKAMLKTFIFQRLENRWMILPKPMATLEKQFIREIISSL